MMEMLARFAGKKFFITMAGIGAIWVFVQAYLQLVGMENVEPLHALILVCAAIFGVSIVCLGGGISVGLSDFGKGASTGVRPAEEKPQKLP